ncbi:MAG: type II toxin-antitoxin system VapC family toxin [Terrimicrobiaceae bacterium]
MTHLLDTDTCIHLLRGNLAVVARAERHSPGDLAISAITRFELLYGVERCTPAWKVKESGKVRLLLENLVILPFTGETSPHAATIRASLEAAGHPIGPMDVLIAATALENDLPLVTNNLDEFQRVPRLSCLTWCGESLNA